ncbi:hypothetical protein [Christiangramia sp.]|uniref:hypothetical protein n=1 Tax=Christiangramia sp. TaxID=1931228 RepID=UPI00262E620C|nr:hypothetical protein [Christiangramia sp.]
MIRKINCRPLALFFLLLSAGSQTFSQEIQLLEGQILSDSISPSNIHIVNLNLEQGTTSDASGKFKIYARAGDTIFFSSVQFENRNWIVRDSNFDKPIEVKLIDKFNELEEVQLDDIKLSGVLSEDITRMPKSIYEKLGIPFPKPRRSSLELAIQSATGEGPMISVINQLNGTTERLEKAEENNKTAILVNKGLNIIGKAFFVTQLEIPEKEIINFLFYCTEDPQYKELVNTERVLKLIDFYKMKIDSFKKLRELD